MVAVVRDFFRCWRIAIVVGGEDDTTLVHQNIARVTL
jgi:hypothetical protein